MAKLDELGDPGGCTCVEFDGPVWLELGLPIEFSMPKRGAAAEAIAVRLPDDIDACALKPTIPNTDTGAIFADRLLEVAFPEIAAVVAARRDGDLVAETARVDLQRAVQRELLPLLRHRWRRDAQRRRAREGDRDAELRELADVTIDQPPRKRQR